MLRLSDLCSPLVAVAVLTLLIAIPTPAAAQCSGPSCPVVTPDGGSKSHSANTSGHTAQFTVKNIGSGTDWYSISCLKTGQVTSCSPSTFSVQLGSQQQTNVTVTYAVGGGGSGTVKLKAFSFDYMEQDQGYYNVTVTAPPAQASITPDGTVTPERETGTNGYSADFTVTNVGGQSGTFNLNCTNNTGPNVTCTGLSQSSVNLAPTAYTTVTAYYNVGSVGQGTLALESTGDPDIGHYTVPVHSYGVSVTPNAGTTPDRETGTGGYQATFTVENTGTSTITYDIDCGEANGVDCTGTSHATVQIDGEDQTTVTAYYDVGSVGSGSLTLSATSMSGPSRNDGGAYNVPIHSYGVVVTPDNETGSEREMSTNGNEEFFRVRNTGTSSVSYTIGCSGGGGVTCTGTSPSSPQTIGPGEEKQITAFFNTGGIGTGSLTLTATSTSGPSRNDDGSYGVPISPVVAVRAELETRQRFASTTDTLRFFVKSIDSANTRTLNFSATCAGTASNCSQPSSVSLEPNMSRDITVIYSVGSSGSGSVRLTAWRNDNSNLRDSATVTIAPVVTSPAPVVSIVDANPGMVVERGACVAIAAGSSAAFECGDLRVIHPLPAIRTLGRARAPMLLYNSYTAYPVRVVVAAHVTLNGVSESDSVEAVLVASGDTIIRRWGGGDWGPSQTTRRIGLAYNAYSDTTGVYPYSLEVATIIGANRYPTTVTGSVMLVNRRGSPYGAGWWPSGLERLEILSSDSLLWIGGDGSARLYTEESTNAFEAPGLTRRHGLAWTGSYYERRVPGGITVRFNSVGQHVQTINALGHTTTFAYNTAAPSGYLTGITLPSEGGGQTYTFGYVSNRLRTVTDPASRVSTVWISSSRVDSIQDPDGERVKFAYLSGSDRRIHTRTDRRGTVSTYNYDEASKLWRTHIAMDSIPQADSIAMQFRALERWGLGNMPTASPYRNARALDQAYVVLAAPRTYATLASDRVNQHTWFWVDRYGAPTKIRTAVGDSTLEATTTLRRWDGQYPGLVTWLHKPNGKKAAAAYDLRGNVSRTIDSVQVSGQYPLTRYAWDWKWDAVTRVIPPMGDSTVIKYDPFNGNPMWQQDARGSSTRVEFEYYTSGNYEGLLAEIIPPSDSSWTYDYDSKGNLNEVISPLGTPTTMTGDNLGRTVQTVARIGTGTDVTTTWVTYDLMDRVRRTVSFGPEVNYTNPRSIAMTAPAESLVVADSLDAEGNLLTRWRYVTDENGTIGSSINSSFTYDRANRPVTENNSGAVRQTTYDPAGNPVMVRTPRLDTLRMEYDALNQLTQRVVPEVDYEQTGCPDHDFPSGCGFIFPLYPNLSGTDLRIPADTATFTYDVMGNMLTATNRYALVRRSYYDNGGLETDTLRLRRYEGSFVPGDTTTHVYGLSYAYDRNGRRTQLTHPTNIDPSGAVAQLYTYHAFGALGSVRNVKSNYYNFVYDVQGRLDSLAYPGGWERYEYDAEGRRVLRKDYADGVTLQLDTITYDQQGRIIEATTGGASIGWTGKNVYSGLGQLVMYRANPTGSFPESAAEYASDALSTVGWRRDLGPSVNEDQEYAYTHSDQSNRLELIVSLEPPPGLDPWWTSDTTYYQYDAAGNVRFSGWRYFHDDEEPSEDYWERRASASFYGADDKLVVQQLYLDSADYLQLRQESGIYEEYWYGPLGRRLLVRRRADSLCAQGASECRSTIERFVWDGDQLLYELRAPGDDDLSTTALNDTPPYSGSYKQYGMVGYTHGPGVDAPLDVIRQDYNGNDITVLPHANWRGEYGLGTDTTGAEIVSIDFQWPGYFRDAFHRDPGFGDRDLPEWFGSLLQGKRDQSGLMYMRNRYYDPNSGLFTQQDPIGIAGGLNLYGFADGDPVNFSDPFGLCPDPPCPDPDDDKPADGPGRDPRDPLSHRPLPDGYEPENVIWDHKSGGYWDTEGGRFIKPIPEGPDSWGGWVIQHPDAGQQFFPERFRKPVPGKPLAPWQSETDPWGSPMSNFWSGVKDFGAGVLEGIRWAAGEFAKGAQNVPPMLPPIPGVPIRVP